MLEDLKVEILVYEGEKLEEMALVDMVFLWEEVFDDEKDYDALVEDYFFDGEEGKRTGV